MLIIPHYEYSNRDELAAAHTINLCQFLFYGKREIFRSAVQSNIFFFKRRKEIALYKI